MTVENILGRDVGIRFAGKGNAAMMFHCALGHSGAFSPVMAALSSRFSMAAFDLPGHGQTAFDPALDFHDQTLEIAVALLERQNKASHLVGHSLGATVALRLAVERPDLVASISLYEPVYFSMLYAENRAAYDQEERDSHVFASAALRKDWPAAAAAFLQRWSAEGFDDLSATQQGYILKTIPMIIASSSSVIHPEKGEEILQQLSDIQVPVMLVAGADSPKVVHHIIDVIAAKIRQAKRFVLDGAGHMGPITHAAAFAERILWA